MNWAAGLLIPTRRSPNNHEQYRRDAPDAELTPDQLAKRQGAKRRPNASLPAMPNPWELTTVQAHIVCAIANGAENKEIAERLDISRKTVEIHIQRAKDRMAEVEGRDINRVFMSVLWDRFTRASPT